MKSRNITLILIGILFCVTDISAQARLYDTLPRTFNEQGFAYVAFDLGGMVSLRNRDNRWIGVQEVNRDGTFVPYRGAPTPLQPNTATQMRQQALTIINNAFTPAERQRFRGTRLEVVLYIDPTTGRVDDVEFVFDRQLGFATIPVATYRRIELELKNRIQFVVTAEGRRRNFLSTRVRFEVP